MSADADIANSADDDSLTKACLLFAALGHQPRLKVLLTLSTGPLTVKELQDRLGKRQAAMSQQLAYLRQVGLVATTRKGQSIIYRIADDRVPGIIAAAIKAQKS